MDQKNVEKKLEKIKNTIEKFKSKLLEKFEEYIQGIGLLPPNPENKEKINLLILVDDIDSKKMKKEELKEKLTKVVGEIAQKTDKNLNPQVFLNTEFMQNAYDNKGDIAKLMASSAIVHDKGLLSAIKISEIHKQMVLERFEKYIVSYIVAGSVITEKAKPDSDIDAFVVIDDTDVKKMNRIELRDKLRAIIVGMAAEAKQHVEVKRDFHVQVWILTDMWDNIKEANPVIFTVIRDGLPLYDKGMFMPWKHLLAMGKVKPSPEAIDMMMQTGDQMLQRVDMKLKEIGIDDFFWATITGSQAAIMLYGLPPPVPNDTPKILRDMFVKKEKIFKESDVKKFEQILKFRKDIERSRVTKVTGKQIDTLYKYTKEYLDSLKELFKKIDLMKINQNIDIASDDFKRIKKEAAKSYNIEESKVIKYLIKENKIPAQIEKDVKNFEQIKKEHNKKDMPRQEINKALIQIKTIIKIMIDSLQRNEIQIRQQSRLRIKYKEKLAELYETKNNYVLIKNVEEQEDIKLINKKTLNHKQIDLKKAQKELDINNLQKVLINKKIFTYLEKQLGKDIEVII
ncbi:MAG: nucleotidyltransferase domain-containing protein [Candidatus Woesearchaeota archaeon]